MQSTLNVIFNFTTIADASGGKMDVYKIVYIFDERSFIKDKVCENLYMKNFTSIDLPYLCFKTLESMMAFIDELISKLDCSEALIISTTDFNIGLESSYSERDIKEIFRRFGTSVGPKSVPKNNLLTKIFR